MLVKSNENFVLHRNITIVFRQWKEQSDNSHLASVTACCNSLMMCFKDLLALTVLDSSPISKAVPTAMSIAYSVAASLTDFTDFLKVKALRNFTLGSYPL